MRRFLAVGVFSYLLPLTSYLFLSCGTAQKPVAPVNTINSSLTPFWSVRKAIPMPLSTCCAIVWTSIRMPQRPIISWHNITTPSTLTPSRCSISSGQQNSIRTTKPTWKHWLRSIYVKRNTWLPSMSQNASMTAIRIVRTFWNCSSSFISR